MYNFRKQIFIGGGIASLLVLLYGTGTLAYPTILVSRQMQSLRACTFGPTQLKTPEYGFSFLVPAGYCALPNRLFPADGSIEIVPKKFYFVFNEYAKGTVASGSRASVLFERVTLERNPARIVATLIAGKFLDSKNISTSTTTLGVKFTFATDVLGTDGERYDWALATHPDNRHFVAIISKHEQGNSVREFILQHLSFISAKNAQ